MPVLLPVLLPLGACNSIGAISGAVVGTATGAGTTNPVVGYAAGIGTQAAVDSLVKYVTRTRQRNEQDQIAQTVGRLQPGQTAPWKIEHTIPFGNEHGDVTVLGMIDNTLAPCKEVAFTVVDGDKPDAPRGTFVTTACAQGDTWKWAQAEPATDRWGTLQ
ncbi:hypothetical protein [Rhodopila sp.]|uniref:hypothetical protein n=1 Tax=Rhodopila sp. TaxID=2480087 RepID=UPI002C04FDB4|nr:hypothetical protein [Rhodopila sp.]HVZ07002.1 hypothetical protein [Rhodopila sp.]